MIIGFLWGVFNYRRGSRTLQGDQFSLIFSSQEIKPVSPPQSSPAPSFRSSWLHPNVRLRLLAGSPSRKKYRFFSMEGEARTFPLRIGWTSFVSRPLCMGCSACSLMVILIFSTINQSVPIVVSIIWELRASQSPLLMVRCAEIVKAEKLSWWRWVGPQVTSRSPSFSTLLSPSPCLLLTAPSRYPSCCRSSSTPSQCQLGNWTKMPCSCSSTWNLSVPSSSLN